MYMSSQVSPTTAYKPTDISADISADSLIGSRRGHATTTTCMPPGPGRVPGLEPQGSCHNKCMPLARNRRPSPQPATVPRRGQLERPCEAGQPPN